LYLAYSNVSDEEFVKESLQTLKKPLTLTTLAGDVPINKAEFVAVINRMLDTKQIQVKINDKFAIAELVFPSEPDDYRSGPDDYRLFREAFEKLDRGRIYVRICNMRRELRWNEKRFNDVLDNLWTAGKIQLHAGDVSSMTEEDVNLSFVDENNFFYATLTWKKS